MQLAPVVNLTSTTAPLRGGFSGLGQTLGMMRLMVQNARKQMPIRQAAVNAIFLTPAKSDDHEIDALLSFVQQHVRYVRDVVDVETLCEPAITLQTRVGDCDDMTMLLCALLESVGYPTRFVVAGYDGSGDMDVSHVYCQAWSEKGWLSLDPTEPGTVGWEPPDPTVIFYEEV